MDHDFGTTPKTLGRIPWAVVTVVLATILNQHESLLLPVGSQQCHFRIVTDDTHHSLDHSFHLYHFPDSFILDDSTLLDLPSLLPSSSFHFLSGEARLRRSLQSSRLLLLRRCLSESFSLVDTSSLPDLALQLSLVLLRMESPLFSFSLLIFLSFLIFRLSCFSRFRFFSSSFFSSWSISSNSFAHWTHNP